MLPVDMIRKYVCVDGGSVVGRGPLVYRVVGSGESRAAFFVDTLTDTAEASSQGVAVLRTTIQLDREVCDTYRVVVRLAVADSRHTAPATEVVVMVTDVNDNAPSFPEFPPTNVREGMMMANKHD